MFGDKILILDFGGTQARSVARKVRSERVFCEVLPHDAPIRLIGERNAKGIILAGGAEHGDEALRCDAQVFALGLPVLALGNAARLLATEMGGKTLGILAEDRAAEISFGDSPIFDGLGDSDRYFERVDAIELPEGFAELAVSPGGLVPAFGCEEKNLYGLQFYPESNDPDGFTILANFAVGICGCAPVWSVESFVEYELEKVRRTVGDGRALIAISGGVDSAVCAALMHRAVGDNLTCLYVNTGLMRKGESELVARVFREQLGMELLCVDATDRFLARLRGVSDPQEKRRLVGDELLQVFADESRKLGAFDFLVQGTIYPDVISSHAHEGIYSLDPKEVSVGDVVFERVGEPLRLLFKDEVRQVGEILGMPRELINRQPFPGPGLAIRCIGEVTRPKLEILREADAIFREEIADAGLDRRIWQYFAVLTDVRSAGVRGGERRYEHTIALRAVSSQDAVSAYAYRLPYDLLERVVQRITTEVPGVNRVVYDMTGKPTALIEWE